MLQMAIFSTVQISFNHNHVFPLSYLCKLDWGNAHGKLVTYLELYIHKKKLNDQFKQVIILKYNTHPEEHSWVQ